MQSVSMTDRARRNQRNFRTLLQAMSRPGRLFRLEVAGLLFYPFPALAIAECLMDREVSFGLAGDGATDAFHKTVYTATGARPAGLAEADFLFIVGSTSRDAVRLAKRGSMEFPDEGATLIYCMGADEEPDAVRFLVRLSGPGIAEPGGIAPEMQGLDLKELRELSSVNSDYPMGVDSIFIRTTGEVMSLPRSTRIQVR
jgi:alpha-D-ribose 1-methylphosphonate 5-triphosphate synthase subunit PhnH